MTVLIFLIIIAVLILVHEFGHFIAAKRNGVLVEEFGIGFPPRLFGIKKGETLYSINLLPIGGFVKVYGEEYHEADKKKGQFEKLKKRGFVYKSPWQRALIIVAGIAGNFILAWVLISYLLTQGVPQKTNKVTIQQVLPDSPAEKVGLMPQDEIKRVVVDGKTIKIDQPSDLISISDKQAGRVITVIVVRNNKEIHADVIPRKNPPQDQGPLGIAISSFEEKKYPWFEAPIVGFTQTVDITRRIIVELGKIIGQVITLQKPQVDVSGPIGIARFTGQAVRLGTNAVIELTALLSLNLAVINILPFPALDGGRLMFVFYEWVSRKRINKNVEKYVNLVGIIILLSLAVIISINDIIKIT
ncbi:site-2 protease family protein, partial [Candidatus Roizmanbacteria bacterium]|nr:site-2 protease family protein [Candidatus Roizmanbacteria bacterium]